MGTWVTGSSGASEERRAEGMLAYEDTGPVHSAVYYVTSVSEAKGRLYVMFMRAREVVSDMQVLAGSGVVRGS